MYADFLDAIDTLSLSNVSLPRLAWIYSLLISQVNVNDHIDCLRTLADVIINTEYTTPTNKWHAILALNSLPVSSLRITQTMCIK
jgi:hypothetical protein